MKPVEKHRNMVLILVGVILGTGIAVLVMRICLVSKRYSPISFCFVCLFVCLFVSYYQFSSHYSTQTYI